MIRARVMRALATVAVIASLVGPALAEPPRTDVDIVVDEILQEYGTTWKKGAAESDRQEAYREIVETGFVKLASPLVAAKNASPTAIAELKGVQTAHQLELERTDKQAGASAKSSASTSAVEKAGINWLLGLAVETGAITQEENKTGVTLSTNPYALLTVGVVEDTLDSYTKYDWLRRFGISATFPTDNSGDAEDRNFDPSALTEISAKYVVWGDRSTRSPDFVSAWRRGPGKLMAQRLAADTELMSKLLDPKVVREGMAQAQESLVLQLQTLLKNESAHQDKKLSASKQEAQIEAVRPKVMAAIQSAVDKAVARFDPSTLSDAERAEIDRALAIFVATRANFKAEEAAIKELRAELAKSPEVSVAYTFHSKKDDADYSEVKALAEYETELVTFVGNATISFNHDQSRVPSPDEDEAAPADGETPDAKGKKRDVVREYSVSLSLEKKVPNFLPFRVNADGTNEIALSLNGKLLRLEDENDELGVAQAKASIPLATGVDLPISVTYATRSEYVDEDEVRGNFGISVDTDKLLTLAKMLRPEGAE